MRRKRLMSSIGLDWRLSKNKGEQKMSVIGIIGAMEEEVAALKEKIINNKDNTHSD